MEAKNRIQLEPKNITSVPAKVSAAMPVKTARIHINMDSIQKFFIDLFI